MEDFRKGSCLCGNVSYVVTGKMRGVTGCHCTQCRKQTGHFFAASSARYESVEIIDLKEQLNWYRASDEASRGFCKTCGSALFWRRDGSEYLSILVGSIDGDTGLKFEQHIFTDHKGDYYQLPDSERQFPQND